MENQHRQIKGYRDLSQDEVDLMNGVKEVGEICGRMIDGLAAQPSLDHRWVAIAKTHLQEGFMAAVRAIAQPTTF